MNKIHNLDDNFSVIGNGLPKGYHHISKQEASINIHNYNVYFIAYAPDLPKEIQDLKIYKMDNKKDFDSQLHDIEVSHFPDTTKVIFSTDYKENEDVLRLKIAKAKIQLLAKNQSITLTNLKNISKVRNDELIKDEIWRHENPNQTQKGLFD
jgi:hypothetical protein